MTTITLELQLLKANKILSQTSFTQVVIFYFDEQKTLKESFTNQQTLKSVFESKLAPM